jgi:hypothetical protein
MSRRDLGIGIALGLLAGIVALILFLFLESENTVDDPSLAGDGNGSQQQPRASGDSGDGAQPRPETPTIRLVGQRPVEVARINVSQGETVRFRVSSDTATTIVVQGYNVTQAVPAGGSTLIQFPARRAGDFGVFISGQPFALATIKVTP